MPPSMGTIHTLPSCWTPERRLNAGNSDDHCDTFEVSIGWIIPSRIRRAVSSVQMLMRSVPKPPRIFATASSLLENVAVLIARSG